MTINLTDFADQAAMPSDETMQDEVLDKLIQTFNNLRRYGRLPLSNSGENHPRPSPNCFLMECARLQNEFERE